MMVETYLRRGQRQLERAALSPRVRRAAAVAAYTGSGFLLSTVGLGNSPQPLALGLICSGAGWKALLMTLGAVLGYPTFWGSAGAQGIVWSVAAGVLAILVNRRQDSREQPLMLPVLGALLTAVTGLAFRFLLQEPTPWLQLPLRMAVACFSGILFAQAARCRDPVTDWLILGVGVLALSRLSLGYVAGGLMAVGTPFPAAALAGAALDLSGLTEVPMTAVMCIAYFLRMIPFDRRWMPLAMPAAAYVLVASVCGVRDPGPLPGLLLGGSLGILLPPKPQIAHRRGDTGAAQVRLELGAELLLSVRQLLVQAEPSPPDREALLENVRRRACGGCVLQKTCPRQRELTPDLLENPRQAHCRKEARLQPELIRARQQLKMMLRDRKRQAEYRSALAQQYRFLSLYLRRLSDRLPRRAERPRIAFRIELSVRSRGKEEVNGDQCLAFSGPECRYYLLLCDGMGTGLGAAEAAHTAGKLLRRMLTAGFPAEQALESLNSLLTLSRGAGAVTVDLAEISLETGIARIYKWGASPSWVLTRRGTEKIGTASPPPGMWVEPTRPAARKLSLRRGEVLVLVSDGMEESVMGELPPVNVDGPTRDLAETILEAGCREAQDDVTAAVLRLRPLGVLP